MQVSEIYEMLISMHEENEIFAVNSFKDRNQKYASIVNEYLNDKGKYGLATTRNDYKTLNYVEWYEYIGNQFKDIDIKKRGNDRTYIENGRRLVNRLKETLKECGFDFEQYEEDSDEISKLNYIKLMTFLIKFRDNENVTFKSLFEDYSSENMEYLLEKEKNPRNNALTTIMGMVLAGMSHPQYGARMNGLLYAISTASEELEEILQLYLELEECEKSILIDIKKKCILLKNRIARVIQNEKKDLQYAPTVFDFMWLKLNQYYLNIGINDTIGVYKYILKLDEEVYCDEQYKCLIYALLITKVNTDDIVEYARESEELLRFITKLDKRTYDNIVNKMLGKYKRVFGNRINLTGLHVLAMIQEIKFGLKTQLDKSEITFYRHTTLDTQKTLKAALKSDNTQIKVEAILAERINYIYYSYRDKTDEYFEVLRILIELDECKRMVCSCDDIYKIAEVADIITQERDVILNIIKDKVGNKRL